MIDPLIEWLIASLILMGGFFSFIAGLGVLRLPDVLIRLHASTKAGTLGVGLILTALMIYFAEGTVTARGLATIIFILITAPVSAHMIGRATIFAITRSRMTDGQDAESHLPKQNPDQRQK